MKVYRWGQRFGILVFYHYLSERALIRRTYIRIVEPNHVELRQVAKAWQPKPSSEPVPVWSDRYGRSRRCGVVWFALG